MDAGGMDVAKLGIDIDDSGVASTTRALSTMGAVGESSAKLVGSAWSKVAGAVGIGAFGAKLLKESIEAQNAQAQLEARIRSTGGAAGVAIGQLNDMADAIQRTTAFSDDAAKGAQALLLTFTRIKADNFEAALQAVTDLSTAMGGDLQGAALQVGKALQGNAGSLTALQRSGVSFSAAQKDMIQKLFDTNRASEAQAFILKELQKEFGTAAASARQTLGGALRALSNDFGDLFEVSREGSSAIISGINTLGGVFRSIAANMGLVVAAATAVGAVLGARFIAGAVSSLVTYNNALIASRAATIAGMQATVQAASVDAAAAATRLAAAQSKLRANIALQASAVTLAAAETAVAEAQFRVDITSRAATVSQATLAAATTATGRAMAATATIAKGFWAAIGGPIGATIIAAVALNAVLDKFLEKMVKANELSEKEEAAFQKANASMLARIASQKEADRQKTEEIDKVKEATAAAAIEVDKMRALNAAYGQSELAIAKINIAYEARAEKQKNASEFSGAELAAMNKLTDALARQRTQAADLAAQAPKAQAAESLREEVLLLQKGQDALDRYKREKMLTNAVPPIVTDKQLRDLDEQARSLRKAAEATKELQEARDQAYAGLLRELEKGEQREVAMDDFIKAQRLEAEALARKLSVLDDEQKARQAVLDKLEIEAALRMFNAKAASEEGQKIIAAVQARQQEAAALDLATTALEKAQDVSGRIHEAFTTAFQNIAARGKAAFADIFQFASSLSTPGSATGIVAGFLGTVADAILGASARQKQARKAYEAEVKAWNDMLDNWSKEVASTGNDFADAMQDAIDRFDAGMEALDRRREQGIDVTITDRDGNVVDRYADQVKALTDVFIAATDKIAAARVEMVQAFFEDLKVREAAARGDTGQAAVLRELARQRQELRRAEEEGLDVTQLLTLHSLELAAVMRQVDEAFTRAIDTGRNLDFGPSDKSKSPTVQDKLLQEGFAKIDQALEQQLTAIAAQRDVLESQLRVAEDQLRVTERNVQALQRVVDSLTQFQQGLILGDLTTLSPVQQLSAARGQFNTVLSAARGGSADAAADLPRIAQAFLSISRGVNASGPAFASDFAAVQDAVTEITDKFKGQLSVEQLMLAELQRQTQLMLDQLASLHGSEQSAREAAQAAKDALAIWLHFNTPGPPKPLPPAPPKIGVEFDIDELLKDLPRVWTIKVLPDLSEFLVGQPKVGIPSSASGPGPVVYDTSALEEQNKQMAEQNALLQQQLVTLQAGFTAMSEEMAALTAEMQANTTATKKLPIAIA